MTIELDTEEAEILRRLLEHEILELTPEIRHTRTAGFREELRNYREILKRLHQRIAVVSV